METEPGQHESEEPDNKPADKLTHRVLRPGESFGNYRVVRCICAGLLVNYYHMQHVRDLHDVTVGIFHPRTMADPKCLRRLQSLQKIIHEFSHEGVPKIRECAIIKERHCIFLDPVGGDNLSKFLSEKAKPGEYGISKSKTAHNLAMLLGILGYAHSQGLDHRDLDSDLIFIQPDGSMRMLGLGIKATLGVELFESIVSASVSPLHASKNPARLNSFDVMSPEYRAGVEEDQRVDVYAAGVIGYWLLTGLKPERPEHQPPSELVDELPPNWDKFFEKALLRNNELRYQSCKVALIGLKDTETKVDSEEAGFIQRQIDRIPVPKGIRDRGELATRVYRLAVIGIVGVTLTALAASFLKLTFTDTVDYTREVAMKVPEGSDPDISIQVNPSVSKVQFIRHASYFISNAGKLDLKVMPGSYKVRVSAPHYLDQDLDVIIERGKLTQLAVDLKPAWTDVQINTEPGASIAAIDENGEEKDLGTANENGIFYLQKGIFAGTYQMMVHKEGYEPLKLADQELKYGEITEIAAPLKAIPSGIAVETKPLGAKVYLDGVYVGQSPLSLGHIDADGERLITVELEGYRTLRRRIHLEAGEASHVDFGDLEPLSGEVNVEVSFAGQDPATTQALLKDVQVDLDGELVALRSERLWAISTGRHVVGVVHPLYEAEPQVIQLSDQTVEDISFVMTPKPGQLTIEVAGGLAPNVRMNGTPIKLLNGTVKVEAFKTVELELSMRNHLTMRRKISMKPGEESVWSVQPVLIPGPAAGKLWQMPYLAVQFIWVEAGAYNMGTPKSEHARLPNEGPQTPVTFSRGYWIGRYEVTQAQFKELMRKNPSQFWGASHPVENVSWEDAQRYCDKLTELEREAQRLPEGYVYRLPTEAEWEFAARAGTITPFSFGEEADPMMGNFQGVYPAGRDFKQGSKPHYGTKPVGSYPPNALGLYDVHGNVREWTHDTYHARYGGDALNDPAPLPGGERMAVRGGSWEDYARHVRSGWREKMGIETFSNSVGFRVVLAPAY